MQSGSPANAPANGVGEPVRAYLLKALRRRETLLLGAFVGLSLWFNIRSGGVFLTPQNLSLLLRQTAIVGIVATGVLILIVMSEIDLSIGSAVYLVSVVVALLQVRYGWSTIAVFFAALAVGALLGAWNGMWVTVFGVPSFIVTLGGLMAFKGVGLTLTNAATIAPVRADLVALSESFLPIGLSYAMIALLVAAACLYVVHELRQSTTVSGWRSAEALSYILALVAVISAAVFGTWLVGGYAGLPAAVLVLLATVGLLSLVMTTTRFGRYCYVVGGSRQAARLTGISIDHQLMRGFIVMGLLYGLGGLMATARLGASTPSTGVLLELDAIAAAVLGGAVLLGGSGRVPQALYGALILATIDNGMSILNISSFTQDIVKGLVLVVAVASDTWVRKRRKQE